VTELTIHLPEASPDAYLRYLRWWRALERFFEEHPSLTEDARDAGGPVHALAVERLGPTHGDEIESQAREAKEEGRSTLSPRVTGDPILWRLAVAYAARRQEWLREMADAHPDVPQLDMDLEGLRQRIIAAVREALDRATDLLRVEPGEGPGSFRMSGELDMTNAESVEEALESELRLGYRLTLDLSELTFMDSNGLRLLIQLGRRAAEAGLAPVILIAVPGPILRVLQVAVPSGIPGVEIRDVPVPGESGPIGGP
jgi:anti-anti-sigma factor